MFEAFFVIAKLVVPFFEETTKNRSHQKIFKSTVKRHSRFFNLVLKATVDGANLVLKPTVDWIFLTFQPSIVLLWQSWELQKTKNRPN